MYRCVFFLLLLSIIPFSIKAQTVYVCSGSGATKYHLRSNCRGLNTCTGEVLEIKEQQALREKRTKCKICGNKTSSSSKTQELSSSFGANINSNKTVKPKVDLSKIELAKVKSVISEEIVQHVGYTSSYNESLLIPNWVAWELTPKEVDGTGERPKRSFEPDPDISGKSCTHKDYSNSGYSRGHMAPAADMKWSMDAMNESFYLSNVCPQKPELNTSIWNRLEEKTRNLARKGYTIYVCCGPIVEAKHATIGENKVAVPSFFFKVLCMKKNGKWAAIGFIFPNEGCKGGMFDYALTVDEVEKYCGIDFFYNLPDDIENDIEARWLQKDWQ